MPDGSDSPSFLERAREVLQVISPPAPPEAPSKGVLTREQAEGYHKQARIVAAGAASVADLCGAVTLGVLSGGVGGALLFGAGYMWLAYRNSVVHHPTVGHYWEKEEHTLFADMVRNYGTPVQKYQTADNFKPYDPQRGKWSYRLGGAWCGWTSRTVGNCLVRYAVKQTAQALNWRPPPRRDPLRPGRRETPDRRASHLRKK